MCDCLETIGKHAREQMNVWIGRTIGFGPAKAVVDTSWMPGYRPKRGERCPAIIASNCPFCGEKYEAADSPEPVREKSDA